MTSEEPGKLDKALDHLEILGHVTINPEYTKFDYQKQKGLSDVQVKKMHTCTVQKVKSILPIPGKNDPLMGLQLDMGEDKSIVVTGMKLLSPFRATSLEVGWTILAINGVTDFTSAEMAETVIKTAEDKVSVICAWMVDGVLYEFTGKDEFMPKTG